MAVPMSTNMDFKEQLQFPIKRIVIRIVIHIKYACGKSVSLHPYSYPIMSEYFTISVHLKSTGVVVVVIIWQLDLQPLVDSVPITTKSCEFEHRAWRDVVDITLCDKVCQRLATGRWFSLGTPISFTNKTDRHDITEILLNVVLNTIKQTNTM